MTDTQRDVVDLLSADHREFDAIVTQREASPRRRRSTRRVQTLIREIRHHVEHEEGQMFAELRRTFSSAELVEMAEKVEGVKKMAPTRPHPMTPNDGAARTVAGPLASLLDHLRGAVSGRGKTGD